MALLAFFEVTLQRTPTLPPPPEFATGTFPSALITTIWNGGRWGARRRCFPKFSGPPGIPSSPLKTWLGAAPRTCSSRDLGHKHQPRGAKIRSKRGKLCGAAALRAAGKGFPCAGGAVPARGGGSASSQLFLNCRLQPGTNSQPLRPRCHHCLDSLLAESAGDFVMASTKKPVLIPPFPSKK